MTPTELRAEVYAVLGVSSTSFAARLPTSTIDLLQWRGQCQMALLGRPARLRKTANLNLAANDTDVQLDTDVLTILSVYAAGKRLTQLTYEGLEDLRVSSTDDVEGAPSHYFLGEVSTTNDASYGKQTLEVWPTPTSATALEVNYIRKPLKVSQMAAATIEIVDIPEEYHEALVWYTCWRFLARQGEQARQDTDKYLNLWQLALEEFVTEQQESMMLDYHPVSPDRVFSRYENSLSNWMEGSY